MERAALLESAISAQASASGGVLGLGTFVRLVIDQLRAFAVTQIDTEEERDAIKNKILVLADTFVATRFPLGWVFVRSALDSFLDEAIDNLPALIGG